MATDDKLPQFGTCKKACALFDLAVAELSPLSRNPLCMRLVSQQIAGSDSIAANIEEGYGRTSRKDYAYFPVIARGSATGTRGPLALPRRRPQDRPRAPSSAATKAAGQTPGVQLCRSEGCRTDPGRPARRNRERLKHWLPADVIAARVALCEKIVAILSVSIRRLRATE